MLDKEEVLKLETELKAIQEKLHVHYIEEMLHNCGISAGGKVLSYGRLYQVLDMKGLEEYNRMGYKYVKPYGRLIKKNGELGAVVHELSNWSIKKVEE